MSFSNIKIWTFIVLNAFFWNHRFSFSICLSSSGSLKCSQQLPSFSARKENQLQFLEEGKSGEQKTFPAVLKILTADISRESKSYLKKLGKYTKLIVPPL